MADFPKKLITDKIHFNIDGVKEFDDAMKELSNLRVDVGVFADEETQKIGVYQEYGTFRKVGQRKVEHIPPRPFLRPVIENYKQEYGKKVEEIIGSYLRKIAKNKYWTFGVAFRNHSIKELNDLGKGLVHTIRARILQKIPPPLKPATIAGKKRKGSPYPTTPLIDTGKLYQSIKYFVRFKGRFTKRGD